MIITTLVGIYFAFTSSVIPMIGMTLKAFIPSIVVIGLIITGITLALETMNIRMNLGLATIATFICASIIKIIVHLVTWCFKWSCRLCALVYMTASKSLISKGVHPILAKFLSAILVVAVI